MTYLTVREYLDRRRGSHARSVLRAGINQLQAPEIEFWIECQDGAWVS